MGITVFIVDDRQLFREGMRLLLSTQADLSVVGEAGGASDALERLAGTPADACIVAQELDQGSGLTVTRELAVRHPSVKLLVAAAFGSADGARAALAAGARGYVLKSQASADLFEAVRTVMRGEVYLPPPLALQSSTWRVRPAPEAVSQPLAVLSARERQVFELLVRGHTNAGIGRLLGISAKTVDTHRTKVLRKIGVHSIVDLVRFAARNQLPLD
ncbi:MAG: LuxR C-terminal-related transcriptional regulator [Polyangia bacterium]